MKKIHHARIRIARQRHLKFEAKKHFEGNQMTKLLSAAAAFVLFAPIAAAVLLQAALIVA